MIVEIKGVQFVNKGAELMLYAILDRIGAAVSGVKFTIAPMQGYCPYEKLASLGINPKLWLPRHPHWSYLGNRLPRKLLRMYGLVSDSEVDVVLDASGFAYGDQWGPRNAVAMAGSIRRWKKQGTTVVLLPQAFGPFSDKQTRNAFRFVATQADRIYARDPISYKHIADLVGELPHLRLAPDFTVLLEGKVPSSFDHTLHDIAVIPNQRMIHKATKESAERYIRFLVTCVRRFLAAGYKPFFLIHGEEEDAELARNAVSLLAHDVPIIREDDPLSIKGIIGSCKAVMSSRYHGLISALSQGVPAIGTSWSHKYQTLFDEYRCPDLLVAPDIGDEQIDIILTSFTQDLEGLRRKLADPASQHKQATVDMWNDVLRIMNRGRGH